MGRHALNHRPNWAEPTEVLHPVVLSDLMPRRDHRNVGLEPCKHGGTDREIRKHRNYNQIVLARPKPSVKRTYQSSAEIEGFRDRAPVVSVEVRGGRDCTKTQSLVCCLFRPVPKVPTVHGDLVALFYKPGADFVDALLCAAGHEWVHHIGDERNVHEHTSEPVYNPLSVDGTSICAHFR